VASRLDFGCCFLLFGRYFHLLTISFIIIVINFLLVLGLLPIDFLILDSRLEISVNLRLFDFRLSLIDEKCQLIIQFMNQLENIEELCTLRLDGAKLECFFELDHACLEIIQLGVDNTHHLVYLCHFRRVLAVLLLT
jgi:hypothetical protein